MKRTNNRPLNFEEVVNEIFQTYAPTFSDFSENIKDENDTVIFSKALIEQVHNIKSYLQLTGDEFEKHIIIFIFIYRKDIKIIENFINKINDEINRNIELEKIILGELDELHNTDKAPPEEQLFFLINNSNIPIKLNKKAVEALNSYHSNGQKLWEIVRYSDSHISSTGELNKSNIRISEDIENKLFDYIKDLKYEMDKFFKNTIAPQLNIKFKNISSIIMIKQDKIEIAEEYKLYFQIYKYSRDNNCSISIAIEKMGNTENNTAAVQMKISRKKHLFDILLSFGDFDKDINHHTANLLKKEILRVMYYNTCQKNKLGIYTMMTEDDFPKIGIFESFYNNNFLINEQVRKTKNSSIASLKREWNHNYSLYALEQLMKLDEFYIKIAFLAGIKDSLSYLKYPRFPNILSSSFYVTPKKIVLYEKGETLKEVKYLIVEKLIIKKYMEQYTANYKDQFKYSPSIEYEQKEDYVLIRAIFKVNNWNFYNLLYDICTNHSNTIKVKYKKGSSTNEQEIILHYCASLEDFVPIAKN